MSNSDHDNRDVVHSAGFLGDLVDVVMMKRDEMRWNGGKRDLEGDAGGMWM